MTIDTVHTCANGSGKLFAVKHIVLRDVADNANSNTGRFRFTGGTKAYRHVSGHGTDTGIAINGIGHGLLQGHARLPR